MAERSRDIAKLFLYIGTLVGMWYGIYWYITTDPLASSSADANEEEADPTRAARGACRSYITMMLNDPGSAEWTPGWEWTIHVESENEWVVYPSLRAKNAFGALVKTKFECRVRRDGEGYMIPVDIREF